MAVSSLLVPGVNIPQPDNSWLSGIADSIGGAIKNVRDDRSFTGLADRLQGGSAVPQQPPAGGFLSSLAPQQQQAPQTAAATPVYRGDLQGDTYRPFIDTVRSGGLTNPYGLAAVASTGKAESGWSAKNAMRTWSDPSESGQAGTAGGILSWRGPRYQALASTGDLSPEGQARFFLQENPKLIQALNNASSVEEAQQLMNRAWAFAGYNRPGGEAARRLAMAKSYYASEFGNAPPPNAGAAAIEAVAPLEQGDTSGTESAYVDPMVKVEPRADAAPYTMASPTAPQPQGQAPMQIADSSGGSNLIAQGVTPVQRGSVDPSIIQYMLRDRNLRDVGLKLWAANAEGQKASEPWQFVNLPDGTLARANQQTGAVERLGNFAKPNQDAVTVGDNLVDRATGRVIYEGKPKTPASYQEFKLAQQEGFKGTYADWEKVKTPGTSVTVNNQDQGEFSKKAAARNVERFGNLADAGTASASIAQSMPVLRELLTQAPQGPVQGRIAEMFPGFNTAGDAFIAQVNQIAPTLRVPGSGAMSDKDMDILMSSLPRLRSDPAANQLILNVFERKAQLNADRGAIAAQALRGEISPEEADRRISEIDKTPLLDERSRSMLQNSQSGGVSRPQTKADFDALRPGDLYIDPDDNQTYRKR
ncbi:hypothetical protein G6M16_008700 [Agrobacterium tumefaciens]|nr:hypothetical protein G6M16_008700 [Agrobacterium tumefaciens]